MNQLVDKGFEVKFLSHAAAILEKDFPAAVEELEQGLGNLQIPITEIIGSGGGETKGTQRMRHALNDLGWLKYEFVIKKSINGVEREATSHEVDHVKIFDDNTLALEIEWNNKDPFFDRDLENFKRLHAEGAISVGIIVTRGSLLHKKIWDFVYRYAQEQRLNSFEELAALGIEPTRKQRDAIAKRISRARNPIDFATAWADKFVSDKYGEATTHWNKLMVRIDRGVGNPCPLLLIGLPESIVSFEGSPMVEQLPETGEEI
ncbi:MAG: BglII/BstYI family type II restriction endonuclease [Silvibacterium sp.]